MGRSANLVILETEPMLKQLREVGCDKEDLLIGILKECGTFLDRHYVCIWNEFYEDENPHSNLSTLLEQAFKANWLAISDAISGYSKHGSTGVEGVDLYETAEKFGIELEDEL